MVSNESMIQGAGGGNLRSAPELSFLKLSETEIIISVSFPHDHPFERCLCLNGERIEPTRVFYAKHPREEDIVCDLAEFRIPTSRMREPKNEIVAVSSQGATACGFCSGEFFPITDRFPEAYFYGGSMLFSLRDGVLIAEKSDAREKRRRERRYRRVLWKSGAAGAKKAVIARFLAMLYLKFHKKPLWILSDRNGRGGDNGEAMFRYLKQIKFDRADYRYAIAKGADYDRLKPLGGIIDRNTLRYKVLHLASTHIISSHADEYVTNPFFAYRAPYSDLLSQSKFVFLQHGITKDNVSAWLNKYNKNISGFVVAAHPEARSMEEYDYFYDRDAIWLTGFARFDRLYHNEKRYVTLMPTWRRYLMGSHDGARGAWFTGEDFKSSDYYRFYNRLINDARLLEACEQYGYTLAFLPHPNIISNASVFDRNEKVKFYTENDEYRDVYAESSLVLTDYSSAVFDFAYLRKPVVYAHFDREDFFAGSHVYTKGYFDYERDGFGEVTYDLDSTVDTLIDYMKNDCRLKDIYRERIDRFFAFNDQNNCARILERILEMK